jgi:hypothetical protein
MGGKVKCTWSMRDNTKEGTKKKNSVQIKTEKRKNYFLRLRERKDSKGIGKERLAISELEFDFDDSC